MLRNKKKKIKLKSLPVLKRNLWKIFSEYTRRKNADLNGMVRCISCGEFKQWSDVHAGHYIPKSYGLSVYFEERNVNPQCVGCNMFRHGNLSGYAIGLRQKYGENILEELDQVRRIPAKYSRSDYEKLIVEYSNKLADLKKRFN